MGITVKTKREIIKDVIQIFVDMDYDNNRIFIFALSKVNEKYNKRIIPIEEVYEIYENDKDKLKELVDKAVLTVTPQEPKIGHWIKSFHYTGFYSSLDYVRCSCCEYESLEEGNYCPNCGARMVKPQESEDNNGNY